MKKISLYMIALLSAVFTGCSDNYDPEVGPQSNQQESPVKVSDVSVTNSVGAIDLTQLIQSATDLGATEEAEHEKDAVYADNTSLESFSTVTTTWASALSEKIFWNLASFFSTRSLKLSRNVTFLAV